MLRTRTSHDSALRAGAAFVFLALSAGCAARVKQEQYNADMAALRAQIDSQMQTVNRRVDSVGRRTQELERELAQFREEFNTRIEQAEQSIMFNVPVHFEFDDATVRPQDQAVLDRFAQVVSRYYGDALITIEGFADPAGEVAYNLRLGEDRAEAVRDYLAQAGLEAGRMRIVSYGEARNRQVVPGAHGPGPEGMENRRVALVIDFRGERPEPVVVR